MEKQLRLQAGAILGNRYAIVSLLGQGGMGAVYLAEDLKLRGKLWAIKESIHAGEQLQQFMDEAEMLVRLSHPYIPSVVDYFTSGEGKAYLVMDYIQGRTLQELLQEKRFELELAVILRYASQICEIFHYLHHFQPRSIIYRDLKPSNIMIDEQDNVRLIDFGIARNYKVGQGSDTVKLGTIGFAAPEQYEGRQTDERTDLYTLGAVLYYILSKGSYPYTTQRPLHDIRRDLPQMLTRLIDRLLASSPEERYQEALSVKKDLTVVLDSLQEPQSVIEHRSNAHLVGRKIVVVGGLYPGAGATFTAMSLAKALDHQGVPHAVVEFSLRKSEYYFLLFGDRNMPRGYGFLLDEMMVEAHRNRIDWQDGHTVWVPLNPKRTYEAWNTELSYKMLLSIKQPVVLIDISDQWEDAAVRKLCQEADEIVMVVDNMPSKYNLHSSQAHLQTLMALQDSGKSVSFIGNRDVKLQGRAEWIRSIPSEPLCMLPNFPYERIVAYQWDGKLPQEAEEIHAAIRDALEPMVRALVPHHLLNRERRGGFLRRMFQRT